MREKVFENIRMKVMWHKRLTGTEISKKKGRMHIWTMADNKEEFRVGGS